MSSQDFSKTFSDNAEFYEKSNKMTGQVVQFALDKLPPIDASSVVHDNASGPGVVTWAIAKRLGDNKDALPRIYGTDFAPGMIDLMKAEIAKRQLEDKITAEIMDSTDLSAFESDKFTHSIMNFAIMMNQETSSKMAREIYRTVQPGGVACATTWKESAIQLMDRMSHRIRPAHEAPQLFDPAWLGSEKLVDTLVVGGFDRSNIAVHYLEISVDFGTEQDRLEYFCHPFWGMFQKGWSEEELAQWEGVMKEELVDFWGEGGNVNGKAWIATARK